ncbi:MAG: ATP synthase subunit a [Ignavibacteria bacterium]|nr:MAG: ATP synthase subunit a [Ignavibacteria bacterium]
MFLVFCFLFFVLRWGVFFGGWVSVFSFFIFKLGGVSLFWVSLVFLFLLILCVNFSGLVPFGFRISSQLWFCLWARLRYFFLCVIFFLRKGAVLFLSHFVPLGSPVVLRPFLF